MEIVGPALACSRYFRYILRDPTVATGA